MPPAFLWLKTATWVLYWIDCKDLHKHSGRSEGNSLSKQCAANRETVNVLVQQEYLETFVFSCYFCFFLSDFNKHSVKKDQKFLIMVENKSKEHKIPQIGTKCQESTNFIHKESLSSSKWIPAAAHGWHCTMRLSPLKWVN